MISKSWLAVLSCILTCSPGLAGVIIETENNDTLGTAQVVPGTVTSITGNLSAVGGFAPISSVPGNTLSFSAVDLFTIGGFTPGEILVAFTDNDIGGGNPDTILGAFATSSFTTLIQSNDDADTGFGNGLESAVGVEVDVAGEIHVAVTGFPDFGFNGIHSEFGDYDLHVTADVSDVDFYMISGLTPGIAFDLEITSSPFDSILGLFAADGTKLDEDDDGGVGLLSRLTGIVPTDGTLRVGVSGFSDFGFAGAHAEEGNYVLSVVTDAGAVPEPSTLISALIGLMSLASARIPRREV